MQNAFETASCHKGIVRFNIASAFIVIFFKKVVWRAFKNVANRLKVFKLYATCLVVDYLVEILIAESKLNIEPVFCPALFL